MCLLQRFLGAAPSRQLLDTSPLRLLRTPLLLLALRRGLLLSCVLRLVNCLLGRPARLGISTVLVADGQTQPRKVAEPGRRRQRRRQPAGQYLMAGVLVRRRNLNVAVI